MANKSEAPKKRPVGKPLGWRKPDHLRLYDAGIRLTKAQLAYVREIGQPELRKMIDRRMRREAR